MILVTSPMTGGNAAVMASVTSLVFLASLTRLSVKAFSLSTASRNLGSFYVDLLPADRRPACRTRAAGRDWRRGLPVLDGIVSREEGEIANYLIADGVSGLGALGSSASLRGGGSQGAQMRHHGLDLAPAAVRA